SHPEGPIMQPRTVLKSVTLIVALLSLLAVAKAAIDGRERSESSSEDRGAAMRPAGSSMIEEGRRVFRYDTFGDEAWWGDTLQLHKALEGERFGGVGPGVTPRTALAVGLKVDVDALPRSLQAQLRAGRVSLDDVA